VAMNTIISELRTSVIAVLSLGLLLCGAYPIVVWAVAQGLFPHQANGSLITRNGEISGSSLIGQGFTEAKYFHPRPSAAGDGYDAANSGGSNLGPTSRKLSELVAERIAQYRSENGLSPDAPVPADAVTASGSGLDPDISVKNAAIQAKRIANVRGMKEEAITAVIRSCTSGRDLGVLGEERVNVLRLNLALDGKP
jgi:potassium-transporting ATPase KdpC subunit